MKIAIIGAGFGGLAAAYDLAKAGHDVTVYEASDHVGGLAAGFKEPHWDWSVEQFYHHWFQSDAHMLGLIKELGLSEKVLFPRPYTVMFHNGKWYPFDSILQALLYPGLGWGINKIRFGLVGVYLRLTNNWRALEKVTVDAWMRKWAGDKVYTQMWEPLVLGKFGEKYAKKVNMAWMWARLKARTTRLGTYQGGFQAFADDFAAILTKMGVHIKLNTPVERITPTTDDKLTLKIDSPDLMTYDQVLVTTSPRPAGKAGPRTARRLPARFIKSEPHGRSGDGYVAQRADVQRGLLLVQHPQERRVPIFGFGGAHQLRLPDHFGGEHILYAGDYLDPDHEYFSMSKEELLARFIPAIQRINPEFNQDWIINSWLFRTKYGQPVPMLNHSENIPTIKTPLPGLYFASMSQVYPWDRGTNFAVEIGRKAAGMMKAE